MSEMHRNEKDASFLEILSYSHPLMLYVTNFSISYFPHRCMRVCLFCLIWFHVSHPELMLEELLLHTSLLVWFVFPDLSSDPTITVAQVAMHI